MQPDSAQPISRCAIALTPGEPAGIGPDIAIQIAQQTCSVPVVAYADPELLRIRAQQLRLPLTMHIVGEQLPDKVLPASELYVKPHSLMAAVTPGKLDSRNAAYVLSCLQDAARDCLRYPDQMAMVTGPIQKSVINEAGIPFSGHTEFLQEIAARDKVVMMLATRDLRVALVTTHLPLREVPDAITADNVQRTLEIVNADLLRYFTQEAPHILVCGLNPHAGENGHLGTEEQAVIEPVMNALRQQGYHLTGPTPADTSFTRDRLHDVDVVVAMYHDQGLPVLKAQGFGDAINITLGLPFVRTSVDHGTALELAGSGRARYSSLQLAIDSAIQMLAHARKFANAGQYRGQS